MRLADLTRPELVFPHLKGSDGPTVLRGLAERLTEAEPADVRADTDELYRKLWEREELGSTGIGCGVAVPHCKLRRLKRIVLAVGKLDRAIDFAAVDGQPVRLFFLVISPTDTPAEHLRCLAAISKWVKRSGQLARLLELDDAGEIYRLLAEDGG